MNVVPLSRVVSVNSAISKTSEKSLKDGCIFLYPVPNKLGVADY